MEKFFSVYIPTFTRQSPSVLFATLKQTGGTGMELGKQGKHSQQPRSLSNPPEMKNTASSTPNRHEDSSSDGLSDSPPDGQTDDADDS